MTDSLPPVHFGGLEVEALDAAGAAISISQWFLHDFELEERIDEPFSLRLTVSATNRDLSAAGLVGGRSRFSFGRGDFERDIRGLVVKADTIGVVREQLRLRLWIAPSLELLSLSRRMRIFQGSTAVEIVQAITEPLFERYGGTIDAERVLDMPLRIRDYCVQHDETDLQLFQRLLAEEGIRFAFRHGGEAEEIVLLPGTACLHSVAGELEEEPVAMEILARNPGLASEETIQRLEGSSRMRPESSEASLWNWKTTPPTVIRARHDPLPGDDGQRGGLARFGEVYEHEPYRPVEREDGALFDQVDREAFMAGQRGRVDDLRARGTSNATGMAAGATFELPHTSADLDGRYAVLTVTHHAEFHDTEDGVAAGQTASYANHFTCHRYATADGEVIGHAVPVRRGKPVAAGPVTAVVVGPEGEEIHTDEHGRIRVRMQWDREGAARGDHETSCWVPVGQLWAGPGFGAVFIPRVGMEVVITFLAGDPDRPLCTGVVYNGANRPPYPLPEHKTRTVLRTSSSPDGNGHNELSFEDASGFEEVYLKAQRNLRELVGANRTTNVGVDHSLSVGRHRTKTIRGHEESTVEHYQIKTVQGDSATTIWGGESTRVKCGSAKGGQYAASGTCSLAVEGQRLVEAEKIEMTALKSASLSSTLTMLENSVEVVTPELFRIKVGAGAIFEITPTEATLSVDTIKLKSKASTITMDGEKAGVTIEAQDIVELRKGDDDACCLALDGNATLKAADVRVGAAGKARLEGMSAIIEAAKDASITGNHTAKVSSGGDLDLQAAGIISQVGTLLKLGS